MMHCLRRGAWLNNEAEKQGLNFSALLQSALKKELKVKTPADVR